MHHSTSVVQGFENSQENNIINNNHNDFAQNQENVNFYAGFIFIMYINTLYIMKTVKTLSFF